ncbi:MAG: IS3 family transposase [Idiomarina sp.]|nr:IS3 family transposase [Idiomarina sp.]
MKIEARRSQRDYSLAFKLEVVDQVEKGEMTYRQAQDRYGIQGRSTVLVWLRKHGQLDWSGGTPSFYRGESRMSNEPSRPQSPEQRIKELEQKLAESEQKAEFFEAVIDVLKKDYGVNVVKKRRGHVVESKAVAHLSVSKACYFMGYTRQAYYKQRQRAIASQEVITSVIQFVKQERMLQPRLGTRKLLSMMRACTDITIGRDRLFDALRQARLLVATKRAYHKTTQSHHRFRRHPNLLKVGPEQVVPTQPEQVWVADITYLPVKSGSAYLSLITDAWSRKIVGHHVHDNLSTDSVIKAYRKALRKRKSDEPLLHHSDRGVQYCSHQYQRVHQTYKVKCSMTDGYDCYQNALAERVNGILRGEYLLHKPADINEARKMVEESVLIYNTRRPHLALKYKTPDEIHRAFYAK